MNNKTQRDAFWDKIYDLAQLDKDVVVLSADMGAPALDKFRRDFSSQFVNVGIAEQNGILVASGLALTGKKVFAYAIAPFITFRCFEQIRVNNSMMKIPINIVGVGAGFGYEDSGPTHHMVEDIAFMRSLPDINIFSVSDSIMSAAIPELCLQSKQTNYVRLDRIVLPNIYKEKTEFTSGLSTLKEGECCILATGSMVHVALEASEILSKKGIKAGVIDVYKIPVNEKALIKELKGVKKIITLEEHYLPGGFGSAVCEILTDSEMQLPVCRIGIPHEKGYCYKYGGRHIIREFYSIDAKSVSERVFNFVSKNQKVKT